MVLSDLTVKKFNTLPLVIEGESKEVRYAGRGRVVIRLKSTIYSYTHNRSGTIEGSDTLRLRSIKALLPVLEAAGIQHTYLDVNDKWILSTLVLQLATNNNPFPFRPDDLTFDELANLPIAPPVEVVVKRVHSGTPKHRYHDFDQYKVRASHLRHPRAILKTDGPYPATFTRFDWRNPLIDPQGQRLADEVLPEPMADWFIDVECAKRTALTAFNALDVFLIQRQLELWDICFFISEDGKVMFGEVSPDCLRVRARDGSSLDKDVWRGGGSSETVLQKWQAFTNIISEVD